VVRKNINNFRPEKAMALTLLTSDAFVSEAEHEDACALYRYWQALPAGKPRRAVDPLTVGTRLIAHLNLLSRTETDDYRYDLVGSVLQDIASRLKPGALAGAIKDVDPTRTFIFDRFSDCAASVEPRGFRARFTSVDSKPVAVLAFAYPLDITERYADSLLLGVWACRTDEPMSWMERRSDAIDDVAAWLFSD